MRPITDILRVNHARPTPNTSANPSKRPISDGDDGDSYADNKDGDGDHVGNEITSMMATTATTIVDGGRRRGGQR